jgi:hypothetical protein
MVRDEQNKVVDEETDIVEATKEYAHTVKDSKWVEGLARTGFAARGFLHGMIGFLAFKLVTTGVGDLEDQRGAISELAKQPLGEILIILIGLGMIGIAVWGVLRFITDPLNKGSGFKGMLIRTSYLVLGLGHLGLLLPILNILTGNGHQNNSSTTEESREVAAGILSYSWGPWAVALFGLFFIAIAVYQLYRGISGTFAKRFDEFDMSDAQIKVAKWMGRYGKISWGVVMGTIGVLAILAALTLDPEKVGGVDAALLFLIQQQYGPWLLGIVALGFIFYGTYSILGAFWFKSKGIS